MSSRFPIGVATTKSVPVSARSFRSGVVQVRYATSLAAASL
jgi:hypothetical protein